LNRNYYQSILPYYYAKCYIGSLCRICFLSFSTHLKLFHGFNYHGIIVCNDDRCIISAEEKIDNMFTNYPIYNLNLNRDDIKYNDIIWSTIKPKYDDLYFIEQYVGLTYLIKGKFYIVLGNLIYSPVECNCLVFDLKEIYESNDFSDEEIVSFPDLVKEYLGIPFHSYQLKFVD
jgi:hypothetical protein